MKGILFDLDGVIYNGDRAIPGAAEAVAWAAAQEIPHLFLTNTTSSPRAALVEKLAGFGVRTSLDRIWTPAAAASRWIARQAPGPTALFVPDAVHDEFGGLTLVPPGDESGAAYVVIGDLGEMWDYCTLNRAFRLLHSNPEARLVALGMTRYWRSLTGLSLDVAPFVAALSHAADRTPVVLGKPAEAFFLAAADQLEVAPAEILMVGDDVRSDVGGAQQAGMQGALVRTGKFNPADLEGDVTPDFVLDSAADLTALTPFRDGAQRG